MSKQHIEVILVGAIATIRLNDPGSLNAVSPEMLTELHGAIDDLDNDARVMILTGSGKAFCAGANLTMDMNEVVEDGIDAGALLEAQVNPLMQKLRNLEIPWISAVRGAAAGLGSSLALAADMIVASENAYFLQAFARVGLIPDGGASHLIAKCVGRPRAMELMLLGERLDARTALQWGLVNRVVPDGDLESAAQALAERLAAGPTRALALIRDLNWQAIDQDWAAALAAERCAQKVAGRTLDYEEGVAAFLEKRKPAFVGR